MTSLLQAKVQRATTPPTACATYEPGEVAKSRGARFLGRDVSLSEAPAGHDFDTVVIGDFTAGRGAVKTSTAGELRSGRWIDIIERQADKQLQFVGYADCVGAEGSNSTLRDERAQSVASLFPKARSPASFAARHVHRRER